MVLKFKRFLFFLQNKKKTRKKNLHILSKYLYLRYDFINILVITNATC